MPVKGKQFKDMTREELAECGRIGAAKSTEVRRRKRMLKDALETLTGMKLKGGPEADIEAIQSMQELKGANITVGEAIMLAQIQKALKGDTTAAQFVRDTMGQRPKDELDITGAVPVVISGAEALED